MTIPDFWASCEIRRSVRAAVIKLARTGDRADKGLWHARHCSLACLRRRLAGKRLDQFGRFLARMPLVINPLRRLGARKSRLAR